MFSIILTVRHSCCLKRFPLACISLCAGGCGWLYTYIHTRTYILGRLLVHVVGSRTTVMKASHDRHCTGLFAHALTSKGTLLYVDYVNYLGYLFMASSLVMRPASTCVHKGFGEIGGSVHFLMFGCLTLSHQATPDPP